jgi:hypothetical protein
VVECWVLGRPVHVSLDDPQDDLFDCPVRREHGLDRGAEQLDDASLDSAVEVFSVVEVSVQDGPRDTGTVRDLLDVNMGPGRALLQDSNGGIEDLPAPLELVQLPAGSSSVHVHHSSRVPARLH